MRIGSLFSGYGGLDMAVSSVLGGDVAWHVEYDKAPSRILAYHHPDVPNYGDVTQVHFTTIEPVDVLTGGYPCQPFSHAGMRKGTDDDRHLWPHVLRAIREMGPRLAILENVRGHISLGFDVVLSDLASVGWSARWGVVRASDAGACHQRARLFIVAYPSGDTWGERPQLPSVRGWQDEAQQAGVGYRGNAADANLASGQARGTQPRRAPGQQAAGERQPMGRDAATSGGSSTPDASDSEQQKHSRHDGVNGEWPSVGRGSVLPAWTRRDGFNSVGSLARPHATDGGTTSSDLEDAADATHNGRHRRPSQPDPIRSSDLGRDVGQDATPFRDGNGVAWGDYGPAIARWEHVIGRPAPAPTEPGRTGNPRLAPRFVEWMMGLPDGHVTDPAIGISRNDQLKALGNGVVPQQAALALDVLLKGTPYDIRQGLATV